MYSNLPAKPSTSLSAAWQTWTTPTENLPYFCRQFGQASKPAAPQPRFLVPAQGEDRLGRILKQRFQGCLDGGCLFAGESPQVGQALRLDLHLADDAPFSGCRRGPPEEPGRSRWPPAATAGRPAPSGAPGRCSPFPPTPPQGRRRCSRRPDRFLQTCQVCGDWGVQPLDV